jgi:hypothetical protein
MLIIKFYEFIKLQGCMELGSQKAAMTKDRGLKELINLQPSIN